LDELKQKTWPQATKKLLDAIAGSLLHSDFEGIVNILSETDIGTK
jgi:hypothetical protein